MNLTISTLYSGLVAILTTAAILTLWLRSSPLVHYAALFGGDAAGERMANRLNPRKATTRVGKWMASLLSCPWCLGLWVAAAVVLVMGLPLSWILPVYVLALTLFNRVAPFRPKEVGETQTPEQKALKDAQQALQRELAKLPPQERRERVAALKRDCPGCQKTR